MNFAIQKTYLVVLMSTQNNAPYNDQIFDYGLIECVGHNVPANINPKEKLVDQSLLSPSETPAENGRFFKAAIDFKPGLKEPLHIQLYRKLESGYG